MYDHDCVIIPAFGGFICNYTPASLDKEKGTFFPPVRQISFNSNLSHNDGLLIREISAVGGLNYGDSRNLIEEFVAGIRKKLEKGDKVIFENIGSFLNNNEGNVQFEPFREVNYNLDAFGLESFTCLPLTGYETGKRIARHERQKQYSLRKYIWRAAVVIPIAAALIFVSVNNDFFRNRIETSSLNPLVTAEFEHNKAAIDNELTEVAVKDSATELTQAADEVAETPVITEAVETPVVAEVVKTAPPASLKPVTDYYLITGSFLSEENAGQQLRELQDEGFNPEIVIAENGFYRVCAMVCNDLETAVVKKDSILKRFPGTWISRKR